MGDAIPLSLVYSPQDVPLRFLIRLPTGPSLFCLVPLWCIVYNAGKQLFYKTHPESFFDFSVGMFTMYVCMCIFMCAHMQAGKHAYTRVCVASCVSTCWRNFLPHKNGRRAHEFVYVRSCMCMHMYQRE